MREISKKLNLSIATISRVLNNKPDVSPETREKVIQYIQQVNYQPSVISYKMKLIGVVDTFTRHKLNSYYLSDILQGADERIHALGYHTLLIHSDVIERDIREYGKVRIFNGLEGILWLEPTFNNRYLKIIENHNISCLVINNCEPDVEVNLIESDNYTSAKQAVEYLVNHGHTSIGFIGGWLKLTNHKDRFSGYRDGLKEHGIEINPEWIVNDITLWNNEGGAEGMHRLLCRKNTPSSVLLCSDFLAIGAYGAAREMGLGIPEDISIISFDDFPLAPHMVPPLTTFKQPLHEMGLRAAERLLHLITKKQPAKCEKSFLRCPLIIRKSVKHAIKKQSIKS